MVRYVADLPVDVIEANVASAIGLVVQTRREMTGARCVSEIVSFSFDQERGRCVTHPIYERPPGSSEGTWVSCPAWIDDLPQIGIADEGEVDKWKRECSLAA